MEGTLIELFTVPNKFDLESIIMKEKACYSRFY
jgi:hypothetical protein